MRYLFIILICAIVSAPSQANVLKCLGTEESYIHKNKIGGAFKALNQAMIGELILLGKSLYVGPSLEEKLCSKSTIFPSFVLLEKILLEGGRILSRKEKLSSVQDFSNRQTLRTLEQNIFDIFIDFLTKLQAEVNDPHCLTRQYPELKTFFFRAQHVYEEQGSRKLLNNFKTLPKLLNDIRSGKWKASCLERS